MADAGRIRAFIAVDPSPSAREGLARLQAHLKTQVGRAGWKASFPKPENIHLTLRFLGDIEADQVPEIGRALAPIGETDRFEIAFEGLGAFPPRGRPRILWVDVTKGAPELKSLAEQVVSALVPLGFTPEDRPFRPHLTISRVKWARGRVDRVVDNVSPQEAGSSMVQELVLYESELLPSGARYTPLVRVPLRQTPSTGHTDH